MPFRKPTFKVNIQPQFGSHPKALQQRNLRWAGAAISRCCHLHRDAQRSSSLPQLSGAGRHRRAPAKGLWQANVIAPRVSASHGESLHHTGSFCIAQGVSVPCALTEVAAGGLQSPLKPPRPKQPRAIQSCSPSLPRHTKPAASSKLLGAAPPAPPRQLKPLEHTIHRMPFRGDAGEGRLL